MDHLNPEQKKAWQEEHASLLAQVIMLACEEVYKTKALTIPEISAVIGIAFQDFRRKAEKPTIITPDGKPA